MSDLYDIFQYMSINHSSFSLIKLNYFNIFQYWNILEYIPYILEIRNYIIIII